MRGSSPGRPRCGPVRPRRLARADQDKAVAEKALADARGTVPARPTSSPP